MIKKCFPDAKLLLKAGEEEKHKLYKSTTFNSLSRDHLLVAGVLWWGEKFIVVDETESEAHFQAFCNKLYCTTMKKSSCYLKMVLIKPIYSLSAVNKIFEEGQAWITNKFFYFRD